jgi:hypothetical protein
VNERGRADGEDRWDIWPDGGWSCRGVARSGAVLRLGDLRTHRSQQRVEDLSCGVWRPGRASPSIETVAGLTHDDPDALEPMAHPHRSCADPAAVQVRYPTASDAGRNAKGGLCSAGSRTPRASGDVGLYLIVAPAFWAYLQISLNDLCALKRTFSLDNPASRRARPDATASGQRSFRDRHPSEQPQRPEVPCASGILRYASNLPVSDIEAMAKVRRPKRGGIAAMEPTAAIVERFAAALRNA